jgi:sulfatase maturation enzyme AslB (radical SAM superfamily)
MTTIPGFFHGTARNWESRRHHERSPSTASTCPSRCSWPSWRSLLPGNKFISIKNRSARKTDQHPRPGSRTGRHAAGHRHLSGAACPCTRSARCGSPERGLPVPALCRGTGFTVGHTNTWIGQFHQGLLEQMYQNRVIFLLNMSCPVYCRFCFRKHKESRNEANPTPSRTCAKAVDHVRRRRPSRRSSSPAATPS